jgi:hypothetical protein
MKYENYSCVNGKQFLIICIDLHNRMQLLKIGNGLAVAQAVSHRGRQDPRPDQ